MVERKLFIGNLSYKVGEGILQRLFEKIGAVLSIRIIRDPSTERSRGFAFVEMEDEESADKAITEYSGKSLEGRILKVEKCFLKERAKG